MTKTPTALDNAQAQLAEVVSILNLEPRIHEFLKSPMRELAVRFPVVMDDGSTRIFEGYRFHHNWALGPTRGGVRFHHEETADDVRALAMWMTIKNACNNIPNGGGKGGVIVDPNELSQRELERVCRGYIRAIAPLIGSWKDFPGADVGTNNATQSWMMDEWETMNSRFEPGGISGKAVILGGSEGRALATSWGLVYATQAAASTLGLDLKNLTAVVQGLGKVGGNLADLYTQVGIKVVGVSDVAGCIYNPDGVDIPAVLDYVKKNVTLKGYTKEKLLPKEDIFGLPCDVLAPCAVQNAITDENVDQVKAKIIIEGANGPLSVSAEKKLVARNVFICPDVFANAGGVQVSHFERMQNLTNDRWTEEEVNAKLKKIVFEVFKEIYDVSQEMKITMRMACWAKAIRKVVEAMQWRGWL